MHIDTITRASPTISTSSIVGEWVIACVVIVTDIILWQGHHDRVMQLNLLYLCNICQMMPLKVWPNKTRLQPSINLPAPITAFMFSCSGTQCTTPKG